MVWQGERDEKLFSFFFFLFAKTTALMRNAPPLKNKKSLSFFFKCPAPRAPSEPSRASPRAGRAAPRAPAATRGRLAAPGSRKWEEERGFFSPAQARTSERQRRRQLSPPLSSSLSRRREQQPLCTSRRGPSGERPPASRGSSSRRS